MEFEFNPRPLSIPGFLVDFRLHGKGKHYLSEILAQKNFGLNVQLPFQTLRTKAHFARYGLPTLFSVFGSLVESQKTRLELSPPRTPHERHVQERPPFFFSFLPSSSAHSFSPSNTLLPTTVHIQFKRLESTYRKLDNATEDVSSQKRSI